MKPNKKTIAAMKEAREISSKSAKEAVEDILQKNVEKQIKEDKEKTQADILEDLLLKCVDKSKKEKVRKPTGKMDKETFKKIIELIQEQDELNRRLDDSIGEINSSYTILEPDKYVREALWLMLENEFTTDYSDTISWFLYEDVKKVIYTLDKKTGEYTIEQSIKTIEELYNYIRDNKK